MKYKVMNSLGILLRQKRAASGWRVSEVVMRTGIDQSLISKYENGSRVPPEKQLLMIARGYEITLEEVRKAWLVTKVIGIVKYEFDPIEILTLAEDRIEYLRQDKSHQASALSNDIIMKLRKVDVLYEKWKSKRPLDGIQLSKMKDFFKVQYTYDSNRIEGSTLTLQETMLVISEGLTISGKSMKEHLEAINHAEAIDYVGDMITRKNYLTKRSLLEIHSLVLKSIDSKYAGRYRDVPVRISGSEHIPPQPFEIDKLMENYFIYFDQNRHAVHPVIMAAEMHERLVSIHPFIDGNGRTSRLIMNFILLQNGYTVTSLKGDLTSRLAYYQSLEECRSEKGRESFYHLIIDNVIASLNDHLSMV